MISSIDVRVLGDYAGKLGVNLSGLSYFVTNTFVEQVSTRSAWTRAVKLYASELMDEVDISAFSRASKHCVPTKYLQVLLLNGAKSWVDYSNGGCSLIYDDEIAERLAPPHRYLLSRSGTVPPNKKESWLECQGRALSQAEGLIIRAHRCAMNVEAEAEKMIALGSFNSERRSHE